MRTLSALFLATLLAAAMAGEGGVTIERGSSPFASPADRERLARSIYRHDFENIRDPDTGLPLPQSASLNQSGWPDFWEPIRAVGFPEYLIPRITIVPDNSGFIPGNYRDTPNHALQIGYDGTRVGIRTRQPVPIDPALAYEYSLFVRDADMTGARVRAGVEWLRIDDTAASPLRSDEIGGLETGQREWPVRPAVMLVNDPPPDANAARLFVIVDRIPDSVGGAYHGTLWLDDIVLKPLPKIRIDAPRAAPDGGRVIPVHYSGLFDNVPDPANPGYFKGKRYTRRVEITDVFGQPMRLDVDERAAVHAGDDGQAVEDVPFPEGNFGVYYFNIRLYDAEDGLATDVIRSVAVMRPAPETRGGMALQYAKPQFGVNAGSPSDAVLANPGFLQSALERTGVKMVKLSPWKDTALKKGDAEAHYAALATAIRTLRTAGLEVFGVIAPPAWLSDAPGLAAALADNPHRFRELVEEAGRHMGLFVDGWQWGADDDFSLQAVSEGDSLDAAAAALREFAGGLPLVANVPLNGQPPPGLPLRRTTTQGVMPPGAAPANLWPLAAPVFPWLFEPYFNRRGPTYPPLRLSVLAPEPPRDQLESQARERNRLGSWMALKARPAPEHEPNAPAERRQLEDLMTRAVYAAALAPDVVYLADLFDPAGGMLRRDVMGTQTLETMARPIFLASSTLTRLLAGAAYLGELWLLPPFEAHVFKKPGTDDSIIALWHNEQRDVAALDRAEIAAGPPLTVIDWAGNARPADRLIPVRRTPVFITGASANLMLTRMSMRINPDLAVMSNTRRQSQEIEVVNHLPRQTPLQLRLNYAARLPGGAMENGWVVRPEEIRLNLAPNRGQPAAGRTRFSVTPDPNSQIQIASPVSPDASGTKIAQVTALFNTSPLAEMLVYLPFRLRSDLDVEVERLERPNDPNFVTLQFKVRWFPTGGTRRGEIRLTPYYAKRGMLKESAAFPVAVKSLPASERGGDTPFESVELRIPRYPLAQTWAGLEEAGGSDFYIIDVTDYLLAN